MSGRLVAGVVAVAAVGAVVATVPGGAGAVTTTSDVWSSNAAGSGYTYANTGESMITTSNAAKLRTAWHLTNGSDFVAPAVVKGTVYRAVDPGNAADHATFVASSVRTGRRLWRVTLPDSEYYRGESVSSGVAVLPFEGWHKLAGLTAVDLATHRVLWSRSRPASKTDPSNDDGTAGPIAIDGGRVFLLAGDDDLTAYNLKSGKLLWHRDPPANVQAIAAADGRLYTGGFAGSAGPGLVAYDGATGARKWTASGLYGQPVVIGSRVLAPTYEGVGSVRARGCGSATCKLIWSRSFDAEPGSILIGGATSGTFFAAYEPSANDTGRLARVSTASGAVRWTYRAPHPLGQTPIRAGNIVWTLTTVHTVRGWSVTATRSVPLRSIALPSADDGVVGGLADADGSLLVDIFSGQLTAYRVPGR